MTLALHKPSTSSDVLGHESGVLGDGRLNNSQVVNSSHSTRIICQCLNERRYEAPVVVGVMCVIPDCRYYEEAYNIEDLAS